MWTVLSELKSHTFSVGPVAFCRLIGPGLAVVGCFATVWATDGVCRLAVGVCMLPVGVTVAVTVCVVTVGVCAVAVGGVTVGVTLGCGVYSGFCMTVGDCGL